MQKKCRLIFLGALLVLASRLTPAPAATIAESGPEELFLSAVDEYHQGHYAATRAILQALAAAYPATDLSAEALLLAAKSLRAEGYYTLSYDKFRTFLLLYPRHPQSSQVVKILKALEAKGPGEDKLALRQKPAIRAVQISILRENSWEEVRQSFRSLYRQGINTVILRVFHNAGDRPHTLAPSSSLPSGVYFESQAAPVMADILGPAAAIAHQEGLALWAWMNTRRADWWPQMELREWSYSPITRSMAYSPGLSPFHPETLGRMRSLYRELARYDIDGILLQDDLNFRQWEGFSPAARKVFRQEGDRELDFYQLIKETPGTQPKANSLFWLWTRWREKKLMEYLEELITEAKEVRPALAIALNIPYETLTHPGAALSWFCLDFYQARQYPIDYFALMAYHRQIQAELKISLPQVLKLLQRARQEMAGALPQSRQALFKLQVIDWTTEEVLPPEEVRAVLETLASGGEVSWALTPYRREVPLGEIMPVAAK